MNKTFKYALSAVLGVAMVTPAFAQGFPDVADTHWAYEAVTRLKKEGIITGYPDGTFQGKKNITRYEMATLLYAIYQNMKNVTDGLNSQIEALEARVNAMKPAQGGNSGSDTTTMAALKALQSDVSSMKAWGSDVSQLKKMASSYEKELSSLGVDVEAMKKDLKDLDARIKVLEGKKSNVTISGDVNFFVTAGSKGSAGNALLNQDNRTAGGTTNGAGLDTLGVNHELALTLKTDTAKATLVVGNMVGLSNSGVLGFGAIDQSGVLPNSGRAYGQDGPTAIYLHELYANLSDSLVGMNFDAKIGRQGVKISPYVMQRLDTTSFFENERYDNGEYALDGITAGFSFGGNTKLGLFLGNVGGANLNGRQVQGITIGAEDLGIGAADQLNVARAMGAVLKFGLGDKGGITASLVTFDGNSVSAGPVLTGGAGFNRNEVYGIDLDYKLGHNLSVMGGVGKSSFKTNKTDNSAGDNQRQNFGVKYNAGNLDLGVGYRKVESNYQAPGDWGRLGFYRNVNDVKGVDFNIGYKVSDNLSLSGSRANLDTITFGGGVRGVESTNIGANFKINSNWTLMATYEDTQFKNGFYNNDTFKYTTLGFGYDMGANTLFKLWYQVGDVQTTPNISTNGAGQSKGSFIGAQFSVKF
ncbi:MAG: S-layer homology domain-containing protein [Armatimonadota bacterium]